MQMAVLCNSWVYNCYVKLDPVRSIFDLFSVLHCINFNSINRANCLYCSNNGCNKGTISRLWWRMVRNGGVVNHGRNGKVTKRMAVFLHKLSFMAVVNSKYFAAVIYVGCFRQSKKHLIKHHSCVGGH